MTHFNVIIKDIKWESNKEDLPSETVMRIKNLSVLSNAFESRFGEIPESYNLCFEG